MKRSLSSLPFLLMAWALLFKGTFGLTYTICVHTGNDGSNQDHYITMRGRKGEAGKFFMAIDAHDDNRPWARDCYHYDYGNIGDVYAAYYYREAYLFNNSDSHYQLVRVTIEVQGRAYTCLPPNGKPYRMGYGRISLTCKNGMSYADYNSAPGVLVSPAVMVVVGVAALITAGP